MISRMKDSDRFKSGNENEGSSRGTVKSDFRALSEKIRKNIAKGGKKTTSDQWKYIFKIEPSLVLDGKQCNLICSVCFDNQKVVGA